MSFKPRNYLIQNLLWKEVRDLVDQGCKRVLIPCGATEAHGATGLGTDTIIPTGLAEKLAPEFDALIAPAIPYGVLKSLRSYTGSVTLEPETYETLMTEIGMGLLESGFEELIFLNGHSGNREGLKKAAFELHSDYDARTLVYDWYLEPEDSSPGVYDATGSHSGAAETGMVTAIEPNAAPVDMWNKDEAGPLSPAVYAYPGPYPIILFEEDAGLPDHDVSKAEKFFDIVLDMARKSISRVINQWESLDL